MTGAAPADLEREFPYEDRHFVQLRTLAREVAGIELNDSKRELLYGRLARRLRALRLADFDSYCRLVEPATSDERSHFVNAITTNVTSFFRESHHFDHLRDEALPDLMATRGSHRRLRIWSAACSTGQEPYSVAMTVAETIPAGSGWDCRILATDIDSNVVAKAAVGAYPANLVPPDGPDGRRKRWFHPTPGPRRADDDLDELQVDGALKKMTYFRQLNLMDPWPMSGPIDIVFCRNVIIYFSKETQRELFKRFAKLMAPDGYLYIGHSESMLHSVDLFEPVGRTIYRRRAGVQ